jgi:hypothetical protein
MWVITVFSNKECIKMYEFNTEKEAREALQYIQGYKIITEIVDYNDQYSSLVAI